MKKLLNTSVSFILLAALGLSMMIPAVFAAEYEAMKNLKSADAIFDVRIAKPASAAFLLNSIHQTLDNLKAEKKTAKFVVVFIGPSVKLISKNRESFTPEDTKYLDDIAEAVTKMSKDGIRLEICLVAAKVFNVDPASVLPEINHVPNGWISVIGYQAKNYSLVPVY